MKSWKILKKTLTRLWGQNFSSCFQSDKYKKFNIKTPDIVINVNPERTDLVDIQMIDGRKCLVIPVDDQVEVNGMEVKVTL